MFNRKHRATVGFGPDSAKLTAPEQRVLNGLVPSLRTAHVVTIIGRAARPGHGPEAVADRRAQHRAEAVAAYLRAHGVHVTVIRSYGDLHTVAGGLAANRRADIAWL